MNNASEYYYIRNGQNDIIGILDSTGAQVVSYSYDTWGKPVSTTGTLASTIGAMNPFRYRGYYYDESSGLYYLNSRYYDANTGRFINADGQINNDLGGTNLFSYCGNNPVTRSDESGCGWWIIAVPLISGLVSGLIKIGANLLSGNNWSDGLLGSIAGGITFGAVALATKNPIAAGYASSFVDSTVNQIVSYIPIAENPKDITPENILNSSKDIVTDVAVNGTINSVTAGITQKVIPINSGWIQPSKLVSSLVGNYAQKSLSNTIFQSSLYSGFDLVKSSVSSYMTKQEPYKVFYPDTVIQQMR